LLAVLHARDEADARQAFETLFIAHTPHLYAVAVAVLRSPERARDVVQDVMLRVWRRRHTFVPLGPIRTYLASAAYNAARDAIKSELRLRTREAIAVTESYGDAPYTVIGDSDDVAARINAAVVALPGKTGIVFRLWWSGLSYAETAQTAGISIKGVERARARALQQLAVMLADLAPPSRDTNR